MLNHTSVIWRVLGACFYTPRKKFLYLILLVACAIAFVVLSTVSSQLNREDQMEQRIADMQSHLQFLESLYRTRQEDLIALESRVSAKRENQMHQQSPEGSFTTTMSPEVLALLKNITGSKAASGIHPKHLDNIRIPFVYQLLPHLMNDPNSLQPAYLMSGGRNFVDIVIGIPTVKRDKESYLMITLTHLVNGLREEDMNSTLIVIMVGETDLEYVLNTARQIENMFPKHVENGLIEVLSPSSSYYPDFDTLPVTLGDSKKRVRWRTKQNLDAAYLMAYSQSKGTFYLMLEDDVIAKNNYIADIKQFTATSTVTNPDWFFIDYCQVGGIGKLFKSLDLIHFITYVQLFYYNLPIDWLLESYLVDKVCTIEKQSKPCQKARLEVRPRYKTSLFQHIGLYSSLKGKIQKVKDPHFGVMPTFYPHKNPPAEVRTSLEEHSDHTLRRAYDGVTYFWGLKPKKGSVLEFWFSKPIALEKYTFRSGNVEHISDKFYEASVEVLPANKSNFTVVGSFDEFGLAESELSKDLGPLSAIRLFVNKDSQYWVLLSEIELKPFEASR